MEENERTLRNMSVGDVLDYSIEVYKRNFKTLTLLSLIFYVPFMLLYTFAISYFTGEMGSFTNSGEDFTEMQYVLLAYYAIILLAGLAFVVYSLTLKPVMDAAVIKIVYSDVVARKRENWKKAAKEGFKKLPSIIGNKLLFYLILFGIASSVVTVLIIVAAAATVFLTGVTTAIAVDRFAGGSSAGIWIGIILVILLAVAVYLGVLLFLSYFFFRFGFGVQAIMIENKKAVDALSRSTELTKKSFWHVLFSYVLGMLLFFTLPAILSVAAQLFLELDKNLFIIANVCAQIISAIIYPYVITLMTMVFINLKIRKEGLDLEQKVDFLLEEQQKPGEGLNVEIAPKLKDGEMPNE